MIYIASNEVNWYLSRDLNPDDRLKSADFKSCVRALHSGLPLCALLAWVA